MARQKTLISLVNDLRAECRLSLNPGHNMQSRDTQVQHLQRVQEYLWDDTNWPQLRVERFINPQKGQRYYSPPTDMQIDRIIKIDVRYGGRWIPLREEINDEMYGQYDSDAGIQATPTRCWKVHEGEQIELWPVPDINANITSLEGQIRVTGIRNLQPLVADNDRCDLDSRLLTLFAAAEYLAATGGKDASLKMTAAQKMYTKLKGNFLPRRRRKLLGVGQEPKSLLRGPPPIYYRVVPPGS